MNKVEDKINFSPKVKKFIKEVTDFYDKQFNIKTKEWKKWLIDGCYEKYKIDNNYFNNLSKKEKKEIQIFLDNSILEFNMEENHIEYDGEIKWLEINRFIELDIEKIYLNSND